MTPIPKYDLPKSEREALESLQRKDDIITNSDKGGAVVIMDVEDYIKEANRQLSDTNNYQKLNIDPTELHTEKIKAIISNYKDTEQISSKMARSLLPDKVKTPAFYLLAIVNELIIQENLSLVLSTATQAEYLNSLIITYSQQWQTLKVTSATKPFLCHKVALDV